MNILEPCTIESPASKIEDCAKFTIDEVLSPFTLHNITEPGQTYTLSLWIRSDDEGEILIRGNDIPTNSEWSNHTFTFIAKDTDLDIYFNTTDTYYTYHPKLETGDKATDYTAAPEDIEDKIEEASNVILQTMAEQNINTIQNCEELILQAAENYAKYGDFEAFKSEVSTQFNVLTTGIEMNFETITSEITTINGEISTNFERLYNYIHINAEDGSMTFGSSDNAITLTLEHDLIIFKKGGEQFGWWDGVDFHTGNIVVNVNERAQFGTFAYIPRSDGSLMFLHVGAPSE